MTMKAITYSHLLTGLAFVMCLMTMPTVFAQPQETLDAYRAYQQKDYTTAATLIDQAVLSEEGKNDAMTWHIRGFIYKDIFNQIDQKNRDSENREIAVSAFMKSLDLDKKSEYTENSLRSMRYLASSFYNDAVLVMREIDKESIDLSEKYYLRYKEIAKISDPETDLAERDITYYKALATSNRKIYEQDREANKDYLYHALDNYRYVLKLDPDNYGANYNSAINLYNEGAYGIEKIDAEAQIPAIVQVQAVSIELFRDALPFMLKAFEQDSTRKETLIGLRGIYLSLNNIEEANKYRDLLLETQQTKK